MDKRIIKTRKAVSDALLDLLGEKSIDKISVVELCSRAGINKSTFYLHYDSLDDCCRKTLSIFTDRIFEIGHKIDYIDVAYSPEKTVDSVLEVVEANLDYLRKFKDSVIFDSAMHALKEKFVSSVCGANNLTLQNNYHRVAKVTFLVGGCTDIINNLLTDYNHDEIRELMIDVIKRK